MLHHWQLTITGLGRQGCGVKHCVGVRPSQGLPTNHLDTCLQTATLVLSFPQTPYLRLVLPPNFRHHPHTCFQGTSCVAASPPVSFTGFLHYTAVIRHITNVFNAIELNSLTWKYYVILPHTSKSDLESPRVTGPADFELTWLPPHRPTRCSHLRVFVLAVPSAQCSLHLPFPLSPLPSHFICRESQGCKIQTVHCCIYHGRPRPTRW